MTDFKKAIWTIRTYKQKAKRHSCAVLPRHGKAWKCMEEKTNLTRFRSRKVI